MVIEQIKCSKYTRGREGKKIEGVVIHVVDGSYQSCINTFTKGTRKASAHYLIRDDGHIAQFVKDANMAWHAGIIKNPTAKIVLAHGLKVRPSAYMIGIEHEGTVKLGTDKWTEKKFNASAELIANLSIKHNFPIDRHHIIGHREIRNDKSCPAGLYPRMNDLIKKAKEIKNNMTNDKLFRLIQGKVTLQDGSKQLGAYNKNPLEEIEKLTIELVDLNKELDQKDEIVQNLTKELSLLKSNDNTQVDTETPVKNDSGIILGILDFIKNLFKKK